MGRQTGPRRSRRPSLQRWQWSVSPAPSLYLLPINDQAGDVIFLSNDVSRSDILTADKQKSQVSREKSNIYFYWGICHWWEVPSLKPSKDYACLNIAVCTPLLLKTRMWNGSEQRLCTQGPQRRSNVHWEYEGVGEWSRVGTSFCALCPPKHNSSPLIKQELLIDEQPKLKLTDQRTFWEKHWSN